MAIVTLATGETIWYRKLGNGAPVLQVHGSAFGHRNFEKMTPLLQDRFEVIDFDLPGYGESRHGPVVATSMDALADQVYALIKALGYEKLSIHGTSFGAIIAVTLAVRHPEVVDELYLSCFLARYDNAARMMRATWKRAALAMGMEAVADLTSIAGFARSFYDRPGAAAQLEAMRAAFLKNTPEAFIAATEAIERTDLSPVITGLTARTLLLAGDEDNMTPFSPAESGVGFAQIAAQLPSAELVVLEKCGHYLVIEEPERAAAAIVAFAGAAHARQGWLAKAV
jgi:pimeloyl-ACP methyl ester carboxylesterase